MVKRVATMDVDAGDESKVAEVVIDQSFDESATFTGKVKFFKNSWRVTITPDQDLSEIGVKNSKVEASCSSIFSSQSPAVLVKDQAVEFRLRKDNYGVYAIAVTGPGGARIGPPSEAPTKKPQPDRTVANGGQKYTGKVKSYLWAQGFGYIILDDKDSFACPEIKNEKEKKKFDKTGGLWFHRDDIVSTDVAVGVKSGDAVQFTIYTDDKGIGAMNITRPGGAAFSGVQNPLYRGPAKKRKKKKKKGQQNQGFGPAKGMKNMQNMMMMPMGGFPMMNMMGGGGFPQMQMMMMNGQPYMMMPVGGKKKKKKNKNKKKKKNVV